MWQKARASHLEGPGQLHGHQGGPDLARVLYQVPVFGIAARTAGAAFGRRAVKAHLGHHLLLELEMLAVQIANQCREIIERNLRHRQRGADCPGQAIARHRLLARAAVAAGLEPVAYALHLPLAGTDADRTAEIEAWLPHLPPDGLPLWLSHLRPAAFHALVAAHPERPLRIRIGTGLWHGSPRGPFLHLAANVVDARPIAEGEPAGYRLAPAPATGTLVAVGVGSTHGVSPLEHDDPTRDTLEWDLLVDAKLALAAEQDALHATPPAAESKGAPADKAEANAEPEDGSGRLAKTPYAESIRLGHRLYAVPADYTLELSLAGASSETKLAIKPPEARKPRAQPAPKLRGRED